MPKDKSKLSRRFAWQGMVILLPVLLLGVLGLVLLRRDQQVAQAEAEEKAKWLASHLAATVGTRFEAALQQYRSLNVAWVAQQRVTQGMSQWAEGTDVPGLNKEESSRRKRWNQLYPAWPVEKQPHCECRIDCVTGLTYPRLVEAVPKPASWLYGLSPAQNSLWRALQNAVAQESSAKDVDPVCARFLETQPLQGASHNALFLFFARLSQQWSPAEAMSELSKRASGFGDTLSESGLPLQQLAWMRALSRQKDRNGFPTNNLPALLLNLGEMPSLITPALLKELRRVDSARDRELSMVLEATEELWDMDERTRPILQAFMQQQPQSSWSNGVYWVETPSQSWFVLAQQTTSNDHQRLELRVIPAELARAFWNEAVRSMEREIPKYFSVSAVLGDVTLFQGDGEGRVPAEATAPKILSEASARLVILPAPAGMEWRYPIRVHLARPDLLYAAQRQRTWLFGGLIVLSLVAAMAGLLQAWKGYLRQVRFAEARTNFVSSVSHELRAPIASVRLMAEGLVRGRVREESKRTEYFNLIVRECSRLTALIENVLDFARIDQGRKQYEFEPADMDAMVRQTVQALEPYAGDKQVHLELQMPRKEDQAPDIVVDARALQQALINLVDNAIKHSPANSIVRVGLEWPDETGPVRRFSLWVEDRGPGIPTEEQGRIFEAFYRRGSELRRETTGIGIGLSLVKHVVESHGGAIRVQSRVGEGSRFTMVIPCAPGQADEGSQTHK